VFWPDSEKESDSFPSLQTEGWGDDADIELIFSSVNTTRNTNLLTKLSSVNHYLSSVANIVMLHNDVLVCWSNGHHSIRKFRQTL